MADTTENKDKNLAETKKLIGEVLGEIIDEAKSGCGRQTVVGLMGHGSEHGAEELAKGARLAMENNPSVKVRLIGPKLKGYEDLDWIETTEDPHDIAKAMEKALNDKTIAGAVALHYPFPLGVTTIGKVVTPAKGKPCYIASSTGTSSPNRVEAMVRNALYGIAVAKADGVKNPTVGVLNLDGAQTVLRSLQKLKDNGYDINFGESIRADGGAILRGNDILAGAVDVCVNDTLTGNVLMHSDMRYVAEALKAGARGYLLKEISPSLMLEAIHSVYEGQIFLSPKACTVLVEDYLRMLSNASAADSNPLSEREMEVLKLLVKGYSGKQTAEYLSISKNTVDTHRRRIMDKLGCNSMAELTKYAIREGYLTLE